MVFGKSASEIAIDRYVLDSQFVAAQRQGAFDDFVDVDAAALGLVLPREVEEIFHDAPRALRFVVDLLGLRELAGLQSVTQQELRVPHDGGERIVQFVRDAGDQLAESGHFFRLQHLRLNLPLAR